MLFGEYDYETDIREKQQESYEEGYSSGISQGAAQQKAEDDVIILAERKQNAQQAEEIQRQAQRIAELEAMLAKR